MGGSEIIVADPDLVHVGNRDMSESVKRWQARATCGDADGEGGSTDAVTCPSGYVSRVGADATQCVGAACDASTANSTDTVTCCQEPKCLISFQHRI